MDGHETEIAELKAVIAEQENLLTELESEIIDLERDLQPTVNRYNRIVASKAARLDVLKKTIEDLENDLAAKNVPEPPPIASSPYTNWTPPEDYVSVEEQFRQTWKVPPQAANHAPAPHAIEPERPNDGTRGTLKSIYRGLVRRYHPDLTTDPEERERRNRLMAEINAAYTDGDAEALQALAAQDQTAPVIEPLKHIQLRQLQQLHEQLTSRIAQLQTERHDLLNGDMMWIKVQSSLASRQGRDYMKDMAAQIDAEYNAQLDRMFELKSRL